jgi:hypothetical protein
MQRTPLIAVNPLRARKALGLVLLGSLLLFPLVTQAGSWDKALNFGKNLLATAAGNYNKKYQKKLNRLLQSVSQPGGINQPFIQGIIPGNPYDPNAIGGQNPYAPNAPYGTTDPNYGNQYEGNQYGQNPGYDQGTQQGGYSGQTPGSGYPPDPNYGGYPSGDPNVYPPGQGAIDPYDPNQGYSQSQPYGQPNQGGYPTNPNYGQYPSDDSSPQYPQQGGQDPYNQYGEGGYPGQPAPPAQQGGYDSYQLQGTLPSQQSTYAQPSGQSEAELQLDVALIKKTIVNGTETLLPVNDGDVLKDGRGNAQVGDKFRIMFRANNDCYVYVIAIDGSAWAQGVFPSLTAPFANPVKQGEQYIIPENNHWLSLDQFKGIETLFFVASPNKRQDIEDILASIAGKERHPKATPQQVTEAPIIPAGYHRSQLSSTPFIIGQRSSSPQGQDQGLIPTTYFTQKAGEALRVTRWFRHE